MAVIMAVVMLVAVIVIVIVVMVMSVVMVVIVRAPVAPAVRCVNVTRLAVCVFALPAAAAGAVVPGGLGVEGFDRREGHLLRLM
ncbi:hypothetical protein ACMZ4X_01132 [Achromobacter marplatensis]